MICHCTAMIISLHHGIKNKGGPENPKAKRQQTNSSNNWFISLSPLASTFLEDEHYGRIHCKIHFFSSTETFTHRACFTQKQGFVLCKRLLCVKASESSMLSRSLPRSSPQAISTVSPPSSMLSRSLSFLPPFLPPFLPSLPLPPFLPPSLPSFLPSFLPYFSSSSSLPSFLPSFLLSFRKLFAPPLPSASYLHLPFLPPFLPPSLSSSLSSFSSPSSLPSFLPSFLPYFSSSSSLPSFLPSFLLSFLPISVQHYISLPRSKRETKREPKDRRYEREKTGIVSNKIAKPLPHLYMWLFNIAMVSMAIEIVRAPLKIRFFHSYFPWSGWLVLTFFHLKPPLVASRHARSSPSNGDVTGKNMGISWRYHGKIGL